MLRDIKIKTRNTDCEIFLERHWVFDERWCFQVNERLMSRAFKLGKKKAVEKYHGFLFALATAAFSADVRQHGCVTVMICIHSEYSLVLHIGDLFLMCPNCGIVMTTSLLHSLEQPPQCNTGGLIFYADRQLRNHQASSKNVLSCGNYWLQSGLI